MASTIKSWIEAMRLRTLPVSIAGVLVGTGCAGAIDGFSPLPALVCLVFAVLAQIASNFANEYFDFRNGLDRKGREGFRRGVTEGDISPLAMKRATYLTLLLACAVGLSLIYYGGWWLIIAGILIALFALAYSAGPYPLSHHGLGDIAVIIFFGIVPVTLTAYVQTASFAARPYSLPLSIATGILAALVLVVNNYRDCDDDRLVGKRTSVVILGRKFMSRAYLSGAFIALTIAALTLIFTGHYIAAFPIIIFYNLYFLLWKQLTTLSGKSLNPLLGKTAMLLLAFAAYISITLFLH
ncbi:MAG: 1,4-dihydroxy-2-naphthoate octaprenyltransferase [Bacteroidales bacterium]|nr:1,4-dihydroxy-2-naphthoate octaprenyltransferase [Bacteroidales bacterium]